MSTAFTPDDVAVMLDDPEYHKLPFAKRQETLEKGLADAGSWLQSQPDYDRATHRDFTTFANGARSQVTASESAGETARRYAGVAGNVLKDSAATIGTQLLDVAPINPDLSFKPPLQNVARSLTQNVGFMAESARAMMTPAPALEEQMGRLKKGLDDGDFMDASSPSAWLKEQDQQLAQRRAGYFQQTDGGSNPTIYQQHAAGTGLTHAENQRLVADYLRTRSPSAWNALRKNLLKTPQRKTLEATAEKANAASPLAQGMEGVVPGSSRYVAEAGDPFELLGNVIPIFKGAKLAKKGLTAGRRLAEGVQGVGAEMLSEQASLAMSDPNATNAERLQVLKDSAVGAGVLTGGGAVAGAVMNRRKGLEGETPAAGLGGLDQTSTSAASQPSQPLNSSSPSTLAQIAQNAGQEGASDADFGAAEAANIERPTSNVELPTPDTSTSEASQPFNPSTLQPSSASVTPAPVEPASDPKTDVGSTPAAGTPTSPSRESLPKSPQTITGSNAQTGAEMPVPAEATVPRPGGAPSQGLEVETPAAGLGGSAQPLTAYDRMVEEAQARNAATPEETSAFEAAGREYGKAQDAYNARQITARQLSAARDKFNDAQEVYIAAADRPQSSTSAASQPSPSSGAPAMALYERGDFLMLYGDDAEVLSRVTGLVLQKKDGRPMSGFPKHALPRYAAMMEEAGVPISRVPASSPQPPASSRASANMDATGLLVIADTIRIVAREAKTLTAFAKRMSAKFGAWIRPHVQALWNALKDATGKALMRYLEKIGAVKFAMGLPQSLPDAPLQDTDIRAISQDVHGTPANHARHDERTTRGNQQDAASFLRRNAGKRPPFARGSQEDVRARREDRALLVEWARDRGVLINKIPAKWSEGAAGDVGGEEHHVFQAKPRWVKLTKGEGLRVGIHPYATGDIFDNRPGTLLEYLDRMGASNALFKDDWVLHAVHQDRRGNISLITSQPDKPGGTPTETDIATAMGNAGFIRLDRVARSAYYRPSDNLAVIDLHIGNANLNGEQLDVFDALVLNPQGQLRENMVNLSMEGSAAQPPTSQPSSLQPPASSRGSADIDAAHAEAKRNGDTAAMQAIVDAQAEANGGVVMDLYHGTHRDFDTIKPDKETGLYFVTPDRGLAGRFGSKVLRVYSFARNVFDPAKVKDVAALEVELEKAGMHPDSIAAITGAMTRADNAETWLAYENMPVIRALKKLGFQGFHATEHGKPTMGLFDDPALIKSAEPDTGVPPSMRFDADIPSMLYMDATGLKTLHSIVSTMARQARDLATFTRAMTRKFGAWVQPHITALWNAAKRGAAALRKALADIVLPAEVRAALANPGTMHAGLPFAAKPGERSTILYPGQGPFRVGDMTNRARLTGSPFPKEMVREIASTGDEVTALNNSAARLARDLDMELKRQSKLGIQTREQLETTVNNALDDPMQMTVLQSTNPPLHTAAVRMRNMLDQLSQTIAVQTGGQMGAAIMGGKLDENGNFVSVPVDQRDNGLGKWLRRSYMAFDASTGWNYDNLVKAAAAGKSLVGVPAAQILSNARAYLRAQTPGITPAGLDNAMRKLTDRNVWMGVLTGDPNTKVTKDVTSLIRRKDIDPAIRALMGEVRDPLARFAQSASFQAQFIARHQMQQQMRNVGLTMGLFTTAPQDAVMTERIGGDDGTNRAWSGFGELYTTPEMLAALQQAKGVMTGTDVGGAFLNAIKFIGGEAKLNKVALNPDSWMVNLLGNLTGLLASGDALSLRGMRSIWKAWHQTRQAGRRQDFTGNPVDIAALDAARELQSRLESAGVLNGGLDMQDLMANLNNTVSESLQSTKARNAAAGAVRGALVGGAIGRPLGMRLAGSAVGGAVGAVTGSKSIVKWQLKFAEWLISKPDNFAKTVAYLNNFEAYQRSGMNPADAHAKAVEVTRDTLPDYSKLPALARELSRLGVMGSFIAFTSEVYRNTYQNIRHGMAEIRSGNPALMQRGAQRLLGISSILTLGGWAAVSALLFGKGEDDEKDAAYRRTLARPWDANSPLIYSQLDANKASFFNMGYLIPQSVMFDIVRAAMDGRDLGDTVSNAMGVVGKQFGGGGVATNPLLEAVTNDRNGFGKVSYDDRAMVNAMERIDHVIRNVFTPGYADKAERMERAVLGRQRGDRVYTLDDETKRILGLRTTTRTHDEAMAGRLYEFAERADNARQIAKMAFTEWGKSAPDAIGREQQQAALARANAQRAAVAQDFAAWQQDLAKLGITPARVKRVQKARSAHFSTDPLTITANGVETVKR